jgi:serine/threonine protein kinase
MPGIVSLQAGTLFAKDYRVVRKLSEGGMGAVYVVEQASTGRERALKLMHPELTADESLRAKFVQEARIGARVKSDHVVEVLAAGVDEATGVPYLVMELLEGEGLDARLARQVVSRDEAFAILEQVCHAVAAAHASGIVHRDLKPENIFLRRAKSADGAASVKVLDFGIAKVIEEARTTSNTGALGSPYWMAPEQTERRAAIAPATDVWALGLVAFNVFAGKPFWKSANDGVSSLTAFMRELVLEPIPPASARAAELGAAERMPPQFDAWFARCVTREPSARFQNAGDAWQALAQAAGKRVFTMPTVDAPQTNPTRAADMALARTVAQTSEPVVSDDDEPAPHVPTSAVKWPLAIGALVAIAGIGGIYAAMHASSSSHATDTPSATAPMQTTDLICPDGMAPIPSGKFMMGSNDGETDERPAHEVQLNAFCIDLSEVTVGHYDRCVKDNGCPPAEKTVDWSGIQAHDHAVWDAFCNEGKSDRHDHPMNCVTFEQARAFCKHEDKRLPSEQEWEYAARGTEGRVFPWGGAAPNATLLNACGTECVAKGKIEGIEWSALYPADDGYVGTAPVRYFPAGRTPQGVFDLGGNVSEWTASPYCPYPGTNCMAEMRATRGSAWTSDEMREAHATARMKTSSAARAADLGFRCAK